jgi:hypothetical protein
LFAKLVADHATEYIADSDPPIGVGEAFRSVRFTETAAPPSMLIREVTMYGHRGDT